MVHNCMLKKYVNLSENHIKRPLAALEDLCALSSDTISKVRTFTCQVKIFILNGNSNVQQLWMDW